MKNTLHCDLLNSEELVVLWDEISRDLPTSAGLYSLAIRSDRHGAPVLISLKFTSVTAHLSGKGQNIPGLETDGQVSNVDRLGLS